MTIRARYFDDYEVGEERTTIGRTITEADIVLHAGQTGDFFPHHVDAVWAAGNAIGARIAHGTLVMSVAVGMTATDINPHAISYGYDRVRFVAPVYIGDTITALAQITGVRPHPSRADRGFVEESVVVRNQDSEVVMVLTHVYLADRAPAADGSV